MKKLKFILCHRSAKNSTFQVVATFEMINKEYRAIFGNFETLKIPCAKGCYLILKLVFALMF